MDDVAHHALESVTNPSPAWARFCWAGSFTSSRRVLHAPHEKTPRFPARPGQTALAQPPTPNDQARFLAGLPQEGSPLAKLAARGEFNSHAKELDAAWADAEERQLRPIREWSPLGLPEAVNDTSPLLYVFSGPDFLHAHTFFPNASTYVLAAVEPVGLPPDVTKLSEGELGASLRNLRNTLNASLSFSFFITADMKKDLQATKLTGTLPVLYVFLARCGCHIKTSKTCGSMPRARC
jgi:hypothetical protein